MAKAKVVLFRESGKYYTEEEWEIPERAITPHDMERSPDFRRIDNGAVLVESQEPWGWPALLPVLVPPATDTVDHVARAVQLMAPVEARAEAGAGASWMDDRRIALAQVHATLATVKGQ